MQRDRLLVGLTVLFAAMTGTVVLVALAAAQPVLFVVAVPLAAATALFWYQTSGRLRDRVRRMQAERAAAGGDAGGRGGGLGAGARREARRDRRNQRRGQRSGEDGGRQERFASRATTGITRAEAYRRLDLEPDADEAAVRAAYRRKVKDVHPDRGGDEQAFKRVTEAYETLVD